jgi:prephenate dehydratase
MRLGYLGPKNSYSYLAAEEVAKTEETETDTVEYKNFYLLLTACNDGLIDKAVIPLENTIEGAVNECLDMLTWDVDLLIEREIILNIDNRLITLKQTGLEDIKVIYTHAQPAGQCKSYLNKNFPSAQIVFCDSTSQAVSRLDGGSAAIAGAHFSGENLRLSDKTIQDVIVNKTRFVVLSKGTSAGAAGAMSDKNDTAGGALNNEAAGPANNAPNAAEHPTLRDKPPRKIFIVFETKNKAGGLLEIIKILKNHNMTSIQSRPVKRELFRYIFFVDFDGSCADKKTAAVLRKIERAAVFYKFLGNY